MSSKTKQKNFSVDFNGFGGIDCQASHSGKPVASDIVNFRIRADGSLEKRYGYRLLTDVGGTIRAFHSTLLDGAYIGYVLAGNTFSILDFSTGALSAVGTVGTDQGKACLFYYDGELYLSDSQTLYRYRDGALTQAVGYVPLVGKDWPNDEVGEPFEPRNLLNRHARISYVIGEIPTIFLCTQYPVESVQAVYVNGIQISEERYSIDTKFTTVNVLDLAAGDRVEVHLTYAENENATLLSEFLSCQRSILFGTSTNNRLFFWDGDRSHTVFCSSHVSSTDLAASQRHFPDSDGLYLPRGHEFRVGDGRYQLQGATRHYDRLLLFTEGDAWMAKHDTSGQEEFPTVSINSDIGCASKNGVILTENTPITLGQHTVWQWTDETDEMSRCNASSLSAAIDAKLSKEEFTRSGLHFNRAERELWLHDPVTGNVWIYNFINRAWYRFSGIYADRLFDADGTVGFVRRQKIYLFDRSAVRDYDDDGAGRAIHAQYVSGLLDFGTERMKNLSCLVLRGDMDGGTLTVAVSGNGIRQESCILAGGGEHTVLRRRLPSGRFRYASVRLSAYGDERQVIHSLTLHTR